jgi:hypothetical protein
MKYFARGISADSFDEVEALYNSIKPVVSKVVLASTNLRPVGARRNKHEYIKKFSKNCYAICSTGVHSRTDYRGTIVAPDLSDADQLRGAPIVWRRTKTSESITIHNDAYKQAIAWYGVLHACLPRGMYFHTNNGAHKLTFQGASYYLPLNRHVPVPGTVVGYDRGSHLRKNPKNGSAPKFERAVTFTRSLQRGGRNWYLTSEEYGSSAVRAVVDKAAKAPLLEGIKAYKKWLYATMPLLMDESFGSLEKTAKDELVAFAATDRAPEGLTEAVRYVSADYLINPPAWRASTALAKASHSAIMEPDHPLRMAMAMAMIAASHSAESCVGDTERYGAPDPDFSPAAVARRYKSRINTYINKTLRLIAKT